MGTNAPSLCAAGTFNDAPQQQSCQKCAAGKFQENEGSTACETCVTADQTPGAWHRALLRPVSDSLSSRCTSGYYCKLGAAAALPCPAGTRKNLTLSVMTDVAQCIMCDAGYACSVGSATQKACLPGSFGNGTGQESCELCVTAN